MTISSDAAWWVALAILYCVQLWTIREDRKIRREIETIRERMRKVSEDG